MDLAIAPGELVTLLGASGSGKTTTLMMVAGFTEPSQGRVLINDQDITHLPPAKRDLGVVFQHYTGCFSTTRGGVSALHAVSAPLGGG
ncbi:MAG: ATP-binding cassette domain-containing protein [Symbiopectobacterium sp.]